MSKKTSVVPSVTITLAVPLGWCSTVVVQPEKRRLLSTVHQMASICGGIRLVRDVFLDEENEICYDVLKGKAKEFPR